MCFISESNTTNSFAASDIFQNVEQLKKIITQRKASVRWTLWGFHSGGDKWSVP